MTGLCFGGNKTRQLEFVFAEMLRQGCDMLVAGAYSQSNWCRQMTAAARKLGLDIALVLMHGEKGPVLQGNFLLYKLMGADVRVVDIASMELLQPLLDARAEEARAAGRKPFVVAPMGLENLALGAVGYVQAAIELDAQLAAQGVGPRMARRQRRQHDPGRTGPGLQGAGPADQADQHGADQWTMDRATDIARIGNATAELLGIDTRLAPEEIESHDEYIGERYGVVTDALPGGAAAGRRHRGPDPRSGLQRQGDGRPDRPRPPGPVRMASQVVYRPHRRHPGPVRLRRGSGAVAVSWDVIVVGAGAAGAAVAARLSEDPSRKVLLLEAGPDYRSAETPEAMRSPNPFNVILPKHFQATYMWPSLLATRTKRQAPRLLWRGRGVGGSTAINGQIAIRGVLDAFDQWAEMGCEGWSGRHVLPFFNRLEDDLAYGDQPYHGRGGPIPIYRAPLDSWGPVDRALKDAALGLGYPWADDLNAPEAEGVCCYAINSRDGVRVSTNDGYLEPARGRPNLEIRGDTLVDKVLLDGRRAVGVRARAGDGWSELRAPAGRAVGRRLPLAADPDALGHRAGPGICAPWASRWSRSCRSATSSSTIRSPASSSSCAPSSSPPTSTRATPTAASSTAPASPAAASPTCCSWPSTMAASAATSTPPCSARPASTCALFEAFSRGQVRLASADPLVDPTVELNMLDDERDLVRLRDGARRLVQIGSHPAVQAITREVQIGNTGRPLAELVGAPDQAYDDWLLADCAEAQHGAGGCCMGPYDVEDGRSVVDPDGRVRGIAGLRVADASVMPYDCKANTCLTTIMIGEHIADRIRRARSS